VLLWVKSKPVRSNRRRGNRRSRGPFPDPRRDGIKRSLSRPERAHREPIPPLRDVILRAVKPSGVQTISGVEELEDGPLGDTQVFAQGWKLTPAAHSELEAVERLFGRAVYHLRKLGVQVRMLPGGSMVIPGEKRPDDGLPVEGA
jgi:hypothetical protein